VQDASLGLHATHEGHASGGHLPEETVHPDDRAMVEGALRDALDSGRPYQCTYRARRRRPDGTRETRWVVGYGRRLRRVDGVPGRVFGVTIDVTEKREAAARLRQLQSELVHVSRLSAAGEMTSALAHELNQPLTAVASALRAAQRLLRAAPGTEAEVPNLALEALERAIGQALRAGQIVRRLREFVAKGETDRQPESLPGLIEEASTLALGGNKGDGVRLALHLDNRLPPVLVDRVQIQQVMLNLIRNAAEAMADGGTRGGRVPRRELAIVAVPRGADEVEVAVADTGPGLAPEVAGRLFEPFVSTKPEGMGVGLSICRTIVEAHGGRLWAESNPGGGTVFRFTLPAALPDDEADE
jgi:PAS domain S-box-containing protein